MIDFTLTDEQKTVRELANEGTSQIQRIVIARETLLSRRVQERVAAA